MKQYPLEKPLRVMRNLPVNLSQEDVALFQNSLDEVIPASFLTHIPNATIFNNLIFYRLQIQEKDCRIYPLTFRQKLKVLLKLAAGKTLKENITLDRGVWIIDDWSHGYFHWMTDALPRLVASLPFLQDHRVLLPAFYQKLDFVKQSLQQLGVTPFFLEENKISKVKELLVPSHTAPTGNYNINYIKALRHYFAEPGKPKNKSRLVYISRQKAPKRKLTNEAAVVVLLKAYNFEIHSFEDYSFYEQVNIMSEARVLISLHGAGLTNMLFMPEKAKVVELRNAGDAGNNCYFSLASALNIQYYYLTNSSDSLNTFSANLTVDTQSLQKVLDQILS